MTPEQAAVHLAVRCAGRQWELTSWRTHYRLQPDDWPALRAVVRERACSPATWAELAEAVAAEPRFAHLEPEFTGENWTLLKPFMWQGDLCFGPSVDRVVTFQALASNPHWPGLMALREAGPRAVLAYLDGYGPATAAHLQYWLGGGLSGGRRRIDGWLDQVRPQLTEVHVDGRPALVGSEHVDELHVLEPEEVRLQEDPEARERHEREERGSLHAAKFSTFSGTLRPLPPFRRSGTWPGACRHVIPVVDA